MTNTIFIGDCWGEQEALYSHPFVGAAGQELARMLHSAGWPIEPLPYQFISPNTMRLRWSTFAYPLLNVFNARPPENKVDFFFARLSDELPVDTDLPKRRVGSANLFVKTEWASHVHQLHSDLERRAPNLIVALGATACWALGLGTGISKLRGSIHQTKWGKVLPCFHPASVLRKWDQRALTILDLHKARRESLYPEVRLTERFIWTEPTIKDLWSWWELHGRHAKQLAFDIETFPSKRQITEIGFAASPTQALHIPFVWEEGKRYHQWWQTLEEEVLAWEFVRHVLNSDVPKIGHNSIQYDDYWLLKEMGIAVRNHCDDTMQMAHCWQPEMQKSLGFLGSIFMDEMSWKHIRKDAAKEGD